MLSINSDLQDLEIANNEELLEFINNLIFFDNEIPEAIYKKIIFILLYKLFKSENKELLIIKKGD